MSGTLDRRKGLSNNIRPRMSLANIKIISGGQAGADRAALELALARTIPPDLSNRNVRRRIRPQVQFPWAVRPASLLPPLSPVELNRR
jgi:hypothetical protein